MHSVMPNLPKFNLILDKFIVDIMIALCHNVGMVNELTDKQKNMRKRVLSTIASNPGLNGVEYGFTDRQLNIYGFGQLEKENPLQSIQKQKIWIYVYSQKQIYTEAL